MFRANTVVAVCVVFFPHASVELYVVVPYVALTRSGCSVTLYTTVTLRSGHPGPPLRPPGPSGCRQGSEPGAEFVPIGVHVEHFWLVAPSAGSPAPIMPRLHAVGQHWAMSDPQPGGGSVEIGLHTLFVVVVQAVSTPDQQVLAVEHAAHGACPVVDHVVPASQGTSHTVFVVAVQVVCTPPVHIESAVHAAQGALPDPDHVAPASHGTSHTVSVVVVHDCLTPATQVDPAAHGVHGSLPETENEVPPTHGAIAPLHTMSEPGMQAVWTPAEPHVESEAQDVHGAFPEVEKVMPAAHATWHTVSAVLVQAVLTPAMHVESAVHVLHGAFPEAEKVVPAVHGRHALSAEIVAGVKPSPATHVLMFTVPHASPLALAE